ncbi:MAG: hypothetical protein RR234_10220, partial [Christensenella sp.]
VRMLDNRYAILFIRGERAIRDEKFDIMRHSRISNTTDGSEPPYCHGLSPHSMDTEYILLDGIEDDFEIISDEEVFEWLEQLESEKENSEHEESTEKNENDAKHDKIA